MELGSMDRSRRNSDWFPVRPDGSRYLPVQILRLKRKLVAMGTR